MSIKAKLAAWGGTLGDLFVKDARLDVISLLGGVVVAGYTYPDWRWSLAVVAVLVLRAWARLLNGTSPSPVPPSTTDVDEPVRVRKGLEKRAITLQLLAQTALVLILVSICGGLGIFVLSGRLAANEDTYIRDAMERGKIKMEQELFALLDARTDTDACFRAARDDKESLDTCNEVEKSRAENVATLRERIADYGQRIAKMTEQPSLVNIWSALSLRVGSALLLVFLVQILVGVYRYNLKLAAFYEGKADALALANGDPKLVRMYARLLSADHVPFGPDPKTPLQEVAKLATELRKVADAIQPQPKKECNRCTSHSLSAPRMVATLRA